VTAIFNEPEADTIAATASPPGRGGVCIVRVSGPRAAGLARAIGGVPPPPRQAALRPLRDAEGGLIDRGLVLFFPGPQSFTGEDVVEFHLHGSPVLATLLLRSLVALGAREAGPGEFTRRAFLNGRIDLAQAEAVADLIESASAEAARAAMRSLEGEFSTRVSTLTDGLTELRVRLEASMDFPDEGVDDFGDRDLPERLDALLQDLRGLRRAAERGRVLRDGLTLVIAGPPNAGKSSLLNRLAGYEAAIVTEIPGTTRDLVREDILIDGMPVRVVDTAGLRASADRIEAEGMRRARDAMQRADVVLLVRDASAGGGELDDAPAGVPAGIPIIHARNKIDLAHIAPGEDLDDAGHYTISLSALTGDGLELLRERLKALAGHSTSAGGAYAARRRHLQALDRAGAACTAARALLAEGDAVELAAEELRLAQHALAEITGEFTSEDLLGRIFGEFCIGK
jgi:tRNA modification GTPase